jgi:MFS family permease
MQVVGRVFFAPLDSRFSAHAITIGVFGLEALAMIVLLISPTLLGAGIFIIGFGMAVGVKTLTRPSILIEQYGTAYYGRISSIMAIALTFTGTSAPVIAGWLYDQTGNYSAVLWMIVILAGASVGVVALSKPDQLLAAPNP